MRNCPHCNREIQDEAVFCRFCRQDVDPPLWLSSLQKCPFCAEWVERGIDRCPLCSRDIASAMPFSQQEIPEEAKASLISRATKQSEETPPTADSSELDEEVTPTPSDPSQEAKPTSVFDAPEPGPAEDAGLAALHERRLSQDSDFDSLAELRPSDEDEEGLERFLPSVPSRYLKIGAGVIGAGLVVVIAIILLRNVSLPVLGAASASETPSGSALTSTKAKPTSTELPVALATSPGVLLPTETTTISCYLWEAITLEQSGQTLCAKGELKRWFRVNASMPYLAIFSEDTGTFAIADRTRTYSEFQPGDCIQVEGTVEVMRGVRPFIDAQGILQSCEE